MFKCSKCNKTYKSQGRFLKHKYNCIEKKSNNSYDIKEEQDKPETNEDEIKRGYDSDISRRSTRSGYDSDISRRSTRTDRSRRSTRSGYDSDISRRSTRSGYDSRKHNTSLSRDKDISKIRVLVEKLKRDKKRYKQEIVNLKSDTRTLEDTENNLRNELLLISTEKEELNEKLSDVIRENEEVINKYSDDENTLSQLNQQRTFLIQYTKELTDKLNQHDTKSKEIINRQSTNNEKLISLKDNRIRELASIIINNTNKHTKDIESLKTELEKIHEKEKTDIESKFSNVIHTLTSNNVSLKKQLIFYKEENDNQLKTIKTEYEKKIDDITNNLKKEWRSDITEQKKLFNITISKNNSYISELELKSENSTNLYQEYLDKYNKIIKDKSTNIMEYKNELNNSYNDRIMNETIKLQKQYEVDTSIVSQHKETIKNLQDKIKQDSINFMKRVKTIQIQHETKLSEFKQRITELETLDKKNNTELDTKAREINIIKIELDTAKKRIILQQNEYNKYKQETSKTISELEQEIKRVIKSGNNSKRIKLCKEYKKTIEDNNLYISKLQHQITTLNIHKTESQDNIKRLKEELRISNMLKLNEIEKFKREYETIVENIKKELNTKTQEVETSNTYGNNLKRKVVLEQAINIKLNNTIKEITNERDGLLTENKSKENIINLMKKEIVENKENFYKQLSILEQYKNDNTNNTVYVQEKLAQTTSELDTFKTKYRDIRQRLMKNTEELKQSKKRAIDLENLLENALKKFTN